MKTSTKIKKEFICVKPRSEQAKDIFENEMSLLHSCKVVKPQHGKVFLDSISRRYSFEMFEGGDDDWEVIT